MLKKLLLGLAVALAMLLLAGLVMVWQIGAWNLLVPTSAHDTDAPEVPGNLASPSILVFTKTNGFRHKEGIPGGLQALEEIAVQSQMGLFATENGAVFNQRDLAGFDVVVFLSATGDMLSSDQEAAFVTWLHAGGGWLGVHAAGDGSHAGWPWYVEHLIGAEFTAHILGPNFQTADVITEQVAHPINAGLPGVWQAHEEWYSWAASPRLKGMNIISVVDEGTYSPEQNLFGNTTDLSMGDHPVAWTNCIGTGRSFYTALGHTAEVFANPSFRRQLANALVWLSDSGPCAIALTPAIPE